MDTALLEQKIVALLKERPKSHGYRALELMDKLDSGYSASEVQRSLALLLSSQRVTLTPDRRLELDDQGQQPG